MAETVGYLVVQREGAPPQRVPLNAPVLTIGRLPDNSLMLADPLVSRRHAELHLEGDAPILTDLGSRNGTFVNGLRMLPQQPQLLTPASSVRIGPFTLTFEPAAASEDGGSEAEEESIAAVPIEEAPIEVPSAPPAPPVPPRPALPMPRAGGPASTYLQDLPIIFQGNDFLARYLLIQETLWEPLEQRQDHIDMYFDASTCPVGFLPWLASWLDLPLDPSWPEGRQRRALGEAMELYRWRGTSHGVTRAIELFTGLTPDVREDPSAPFVFHVRVGVPKGAEVDRGLVESLIQAYKPAHAGYVLELAA